jgi:predicted metal-dependent phosphotriesterase family hydrolase
MRPGHRYAYLMETVVPALRAAGVGDEALDLMLRYNPRAILGLAATRRPGVS